MFAMNMSFDPFVAAQIAIAVGVGAVGAYFALQYRLKLIEAEQRRDDHFFQNLEVQQKVWASQEGRVFKDQYVTVEERLMYKQFPLTQWSSQKHLISQELDATGLIKLARDMSQLAAEAALPFSTRFVQRLLTAVRDDFSDQSNHQHEALKGSVDEESNSSPDLSNTKPTSRAYASAAHQSRAGARAKPWLLRSFVVLISVGALFVTVRYLEMPPANAPHTLDSRDLVGAAVPTSNPVRQVEQKSTSADPASTQELAAGETAIAENQPQTVRTISRTTAPIQSTLESSGRDATSETIGERPTIASSPSEVIRLRAKHIHSMGSCEGTIALSGTSFEFTSSQHSVRVDRATVKLDGPGVRDWTGKKWHFKISGRSEEKTRAMLSEWVSAGRLPASYASQRAAF